MPARLYSTDADKPLYLPTRLPLILIRYLQVVVRLKHLHFVFTSHASLQAEIIERFLATAPYKRKFCWSTPKVPSIDDDPVAFRQVNFGVPPVLAQAVDAACRQVKVSRATFLYSAALFYVRHIASPKALGLAWLSL